MKKVLILLGVFASLITMAQAPQKINYQAVVRNSSGVPIVSTSINFTITISNSSTFMESQTVSSNSVGIVTLVIGSGSLLTPSTPLSAIDWSINPTNITVVMDIGSGPVTVANQQLVSVPYALYAEKSGSSSSSSSTYSPSANVSLTGNVVDLTNSGVTAATYGANAGPNSSIPTFFVDAKGRLTSAGQYSANINGDISGTLDNQKVKGLNGIPLSSSAPTTGQSLTYNGTNWAPTTAASSLWTVGSTTDQVILANPNANVGVGVTAPANRLDVSTPVGFPNNDMQIGSLGSGHALQIFKFASTGNGIFLAMNASSNATAVAIGHAGPGPGITCDVATNNAISATSTGSVAATIQGQNKGGSGPSIRGFRTGAGNTGPVALFDQTGNSSFETVLATTDGNGAAIRAVGNGTVAGSKPIALTVENGHIRTVGAAPTVGNSTTGGLTVSTSTVLTGSNDVSGILTLTASGAGLSGSSSMDITVTFNRNYVNPPKVIVTPTSNLGPFAYYIAATSVSSFTLRMYIFPGGPTTSFGPLSYGFNYMVME